MKLWDLPTGRELRSFTGHSNAVESVTFSPDGKLALSGSRDGTMKLWDLATGSCLCTFLANNDGSKWLTYTEDGYWDGSDKCGELVAMAKGLEGYSIEQFAIRIPRPHDRLRGPCRRTGYRADGSYRFIDGDPQGLPHGPRHRAGRHRLDRRGWIHPDSGCRLHHLP